MAKSVKRNVSTSQLNNASQVKDSANINTNPYLNTTVYGSELFLPTTSGNASNKSLATPTNYEIGPNDVLKLVIYGVQEYSADLLVSKEGKILVDNVGAIKVGGLNIEAAKSRIKQQMATTAYSSLSRGESKIDLTLGDIQRLVRGDENWSQGGMPDVLAAVMSEPFGKDKRKMNSGDAYIGFVKFPKNGGLPFI